MFGALMWGNSFRLMRDDKIIGLTNKTTYKTLCDIVQLKMKLFKIPPNIILTEIKYGLGELYSLKKDKSFYQYSREYTINGNANPYIVDISSSNPFPKEKLSVKYRWGATLDYSKAAKQLSVMEIEDISLLTNFNANSIYWNDKGDSLEMYFGNSFQNVVDGVVEIFSLRQPEQNVTLANYSTIYLEMLEADISDLVEIVCNKLRIN